jgi:REP element-mobilizing transposase RayT
MLRLRKRHIQQELFAPKKKRGGKRRNAGRKPKGFRAGSPHKARPRLKRLTPMHIVLRVVPAIGSLRKRLMYKALRWATLAVARREMHFREEGVFRIVHISIQRTHVHLIVEADRADALARGMQSFQISAAKHMNAAVSVGLARRRRGTVFPDRYHQEVITCPTQARHTLAYVMNNWRKHREDALRKWNVDPYSTGVVFWGWKERVDAEVMWRWPETYEPLLVLTPLTWLLTTGWMRGGPMVRYREVPGPRWQGRRVPIASCDKPVSLRRDGAIDAGFEHTRVLG